MGLPVYWVNGEADASPTPADRGLSYGDGVFETFRCHRGRIHLWDYHWQRLSRGLAVLGIECSRDRVEDQLGQGKQFLERQGIEHAAGRLTVTRGPADRGYGSAASNPTLILGLSDLTPWRRALPPLRAIFCDIRLPDQPALAGIKHCNRLEQVLAARQLGRSGAPDGVLLNRSDEMVCGVSSNIFLVCEGELLTPPVERCGVAGTVRALIIEKLAPTAAIPVRVTALGVESLAGASEVLFTNALGGIRNVDRCGEHAFTSSECGDTLRASFYSWSESTGW